MATSEAATFFDYHRTIIGYHGTRRSTATELVDGAAFGPSTNDDDWLGHGIYFWEHAPQQAWWWARSRYGDDEAAVVGASIRLGACFDLLDPANAEVLKEAHRGLEQELKSRGKRLPNNANKNKFRDCAVFNYLYEKLDAASYAFESTRAVFVPMVKTGYARLWKRSGVFAGAHIQICLREPLNILSVWSVRRDGRYGKDK